MQRLRKQLRHSGNETNYKKLFQLNRPSAPRNTIHSTSGFHSEDRDLSLRKQVQSTSEWNTDGTHYSRTVA